MCINRHIDQSEELVEQIADCEIVVIMRERTPFRASLLAQLPRLKLLITGMRNASIDLTAAASQGVIVCGTGGAGNATAETHSAGLFIVGSISPLCSN